MPDYLALAVGNADLRFYDFTAKAEGNSLRANGAAVTAVAGGGAVGPVGPRTGTSSGILPGNSSGRGDSPGSCTGGGISGRGLPGGIPGGGSVGVPGVAGGISGGSIGVMIRSSWNLRKR